MGAADLERDGVERTAELLARARRLLAYESVDWIGRRPLSAPDGAVFPHFAASARGYELTDTAGRGFVDWVSAWGPVLLGYGHPEVDAAIRAQLDAGPTLSLTHPIEIEVASLLSEMVPCAEMVAFAKNGCDVLAAAVATARAATRRQIVLRHGTERFQEWSELQGFGASAGEPLMHEFPYDDGEALGGLLERFSGQVAAVLMEPVRDVLPSPGYLPGVRELCDRHGALLVFNEVVTGFRLANGGAQEYFGVTPDLACLGKAMANGMPLSALVGRRRCMQRMPPFAFDSTYRGETLSLAAARAVLGILRREPVIEHLARIGSAVRSEFDDACAKAGVRAALKGPPQRMSFCFEDAGARTGEQLRALFVQECLKHGVLTNGHLLPCYAHDAEAVRRTRLGFDAALPVVAEAARAAPGSAGPCLCASRGYVNFARRDAALAVAGWMLLEDGPPDRVAIVSPDGVRCLAERRERPDVARVFPGIPGAAQGGYEAMLPARDFQRDGVWSFALCALLGERSVFRCEVRLREHPDASVPAGPHATGDGLVRVGVPAV